MPTALTSPLGQATQLRHDVCGTVAVGTVEARSRWLFAINLQGGLIMGDVLPSQLANSIMGKLYDVLTNGDETTPKTEDNFFT